MIASTVLQDAISNFLTNVSRYTGIPFCLLDHDKNEVVRTQGEKDPEYTTEIGYRTERTITMRDDTVWYLYTLDQPLPGTELLREQVLDFTKEVVVFIINNEEEMQNLSTELIERYQELHVLYDVINDVSSLLDEEEICRTVLQKAMQALDVRFGAVAFMNAADGMRIRSMEGHADLPPEVSLAGIAADVCAANTHIIVEKDEASTGIPALLAVPVTANNAPIGAMIVSGKRLGENFTTGDRISLTALAGYLGIAMKSASLIKEAHEAEALRREIDFARKIQENLLPKRLPDISTLEIAARCIPAADVGGDLFTFFRRSENEWAFGIADVAGHGLGAAFILASLRSILRSECRSEADLEAVICETNNTLCEDTELNELYATLLMATYDNAARTLRAVNAGHPPGIVWHAASQSLEMLGSGGMAVGLFRDETYEYDEMTLEPGDVLLLYTDGIIESKNPSNEFYGIERLQTFLVNNAEKNANAILMALMDDIATFRGDAPQNDDITTVIAKVRDNA